MEKRRPTAEDIMRIADNDLELSKNFKVASKYLTPWIGGRNFLYGCWPNFSWYKERLLDLNKEIK